MLNLKNKKGIALVSLMIAIVVLLMLSGIVAFVSVDTISMSKKTAFLQNTDTIYKKVQEYYSVNGDIPILQNNGKILAKEQYIDEIRNLNDSEVAKGLDEEILKNGDNGATFYEIDISKLGIDELQYGVKSTDDDVYMISNITYNVYYYPGYKIDNTVYFSAVNINKES